MTPKPTPSGRALEAYKKLNQHNTHAFIRDHGDAIYTALLRSQAIESGSEAHAFASRKADPDDYMRGYRDCLESLKGIGHDDR